MCGIAGILRLDGVSPDPALLPRMTDAIAHRGPDGSGHWQEGQIALGHRRLAIIDLSVNANQPMWSFDGSLVIVFNGEIYNYRGLRETLAGGGAGMPCRTQSDTEVILNLYRLHGPDCVAMLRGMFAFAIWDRGRRELFLARDRVGIKPLYYLHSPQALVFGSEVKAVAASGLSALRVDPAALAGLMRFLVVPQPGTIFSDVRKLEPGRWLRVSADGRVTEQVYWSPPAPGEEPGPADAVERLDRTLRESVRYHLVADVPVGAFLSGGLDSSTVAACMRAEAPGQRIDTFSISFPGEARFDEARWAAEVARRNQLGHHLETITPDFLADFDNIAWHLDEPFAISSAYATWYLAQSAARHTKVVLTGDGGDELFAGYEGYQNDRYLRSLGVRLAAELAWPVLIAAARGTRHRHAGLERLLIAARRRAGSEAVRYSEQAAMNSLTACGLVLNHELFMQLLAGWEDNAVARYYAEAEGGDRLSRRLYADYKTRLVDEMLMKVDRMTMAHSLEARVPLLDHRVVELAFELPPSLKLRRTAAGAEGKYILKRVAEAYLPREIVYRRKQGFNVPVRNWLQGDFRAAVRDRLLGGVLQQRGIIRPQGVETLLERQSDVRHNYSLMVLALLSLETWARVHEARLAPVAWS